MTLCTALNFWILVSKEATNFRRDKHQPIISPQTEQIHISLSHVFYRYKHCSNMKELLSVHNLVTITTEQTTDILTCVL